MSLNANNIDFNKILDMFFNEVSLSLESINNEFSNNTLLKLFFLATIKDFTPDESIKIFKNKTKGNAKLSMQFTENLQNILNTPEIKQQLISFDELFEKISLSLNFNNDKVILDLIYSIAAFKIEKKVNQFSISFWNNLKIILFYPNPNTIDKAITLIEILVSRIFRQFENKQFSLCKFFTCEFLLSIIKEQNANAIQKITVLYFVFIYKFHYSNLKDKVIKPNGEINNAFNFSNFMMLSVFQEEFYSNFSFIELHFELINNYNIQNYKIKNMFFLLSNTIRQFFNEYDINIYSTKPFLRQINNANVEHCLIELLLSNNTYDSNSNSNIDIDKTVSTWTNIFYVNPYKTTMLTIRIFFFKELILQDNFNYFDIDEIFSHLLINFPKNNSFIIIFVKCVTILYVIFNNDLTNYSFLIDGSFQEIQNNILLFNTKLIKLLYKIQLDYRFIFQKMRENIILTLNDIISEHKQCFHLIICDNEIFDEKMVQFLLYEVEISHICLRFFDDFIDPKKNPIIILNGFLLIAHWVNKYPLEEIYNKLSNYLTVFQKRIDLRGVLVNEDNVNKFLKGIYLLFKAFPKKPEELQSFLRYVRNSITIWISDYSLANYSKDQVDKLNQFIHTEIINSNYRNKNTCYSKINTKRNNK